MLWGGSSCSLGWDPSAFPCQVAKGAAGYRPLLLFPRWGIMGVPLLPCPQKSAPPTRVKEPGSLKKKKKKNLLDGLKRLPGECLGCSGAICTQPCRRAELGPILAHTCASKGSTFS